MELKFKLYNLKEESSLYESVVKKSHKRNDFIVFGETIGEDGCDYYKALQFGNQFGVSGMVFLGLTLDTFSILVKKEDFNYVESIDFDIPDVYLNSGIIEDIRKINEN